MREKIHSRDKQCLNSKLYLQDHQEVANALGKKSYRRSEATLQNRSQVISINTGSVTEEHSFIVTNMLLFL